MANSTETHEPQDESGSLPADGAVFVDTSGRRRSVLRGLGWVIAVYCVSFAATLVVVIAGGSAAAPWLPITADADEVQNADRAAGPAFSAGPVSPRPKAADTPPAGEGDAPEWTADGPLGAGATESPDGAAELLMASKSPAAEVGSSTQRPAPGQSRTTPESTSPRPATPSASVSPPEPTGDATPAQSPEPPATTGGPGGGTASPTTGPSAGPTTGPSTGPTADPTPTDGLAGGVADVLASASELLVSS
ncbi:hypothetical protein [Streptomyces cavernae]|uniref:hypothetical protein n=1 Tax=Streptomyces cavernae TaxID=2259034 RepID=UPI000FEBB027|nr:hypothetical protein [Streptomyces cavernae]